MNRKQKILIVDDEKMILNALRNAFNSAGFSTTTASCGADALNLISNLSFTAAVIDLLLPDISGLEIIRGIRKQSPQVAIFAMSALDDQNSINELNNLGVDSFFIKPFADIFQIPKKVQLVLQHGAAREGKGQN